MDSLQQSSILIYEKVLKNTIRATEAGFMDEGIPYDAEMISLWAQNLYITFMDIAKVPLLKLQEESRKMFSIPRNVLLEADQYKVKHYTDTDLLQLKLDVEKLEDDLIKEQMLLSRRGCLKKMIEDSITPMYDKVNDILSTACEKVSQYSRKCDVDKKQLSDNLLVDETCSINYKVKGYALSNGSPGNLKIDLANGCNMIYCHDILVHTPNVHENNEVVSVGYRFGLYQDNNRFLTKPQVSFYQSGKFV
ncbi:unnamed protein product [Callosobruchus maculatus]|uniref:Uncharacterized protein n=1 Tax=Callosobruchus maculatus TaxID=64391 RepID=A0A653CAH5_CALMS|nr:unnamed protein product [Callosobruchus maculatus]